MKKLLLCLIVLVAAVSMVAAEGVPGTITIENELSSEVIRSFKNTNNSYTGEYVDNTTFGEVEDKFTVSIETDILDAEFNYRAEFSNYTGFNGNYTNYEHAKELYNYGSLGYGVACNYIEFKPFDLIHVSRKAYKTAGSYLPVSDDYMVDGIIDNGAVVVDVFPVDGLMVSAGFADGAVLYNDGYDNVNGTDGKQHPKVKPSILAGFEWRATEDLTIAGTMNNILNPKTVYTDADRNKVEYNTSRCGLFASFDALNLTGQNLTVGGGYEFHLNDYQPYTGYNTGKLVLGTVQYDYDAVSCAFEGIFAVGEKSKYFELNGYIGAKEVLAAKVGYQIDEQFKVSLGLKTQNYDPDDIKMKYITVTPDVTYTPTSQDTITAGIKVYKQKYESELSQKYARQEITIPVSWKHTF